MPGVPLERLGGAARTARTLQRAGLLPAIRPDRLARVATTLARWGITPAAGYRAGALARPRAPAIVDERGSLTFAEVQRRTNALAHALSDRGIGEGDGVALLCRNHRGLIEATVACAKLGADALYLNTAFAGRQVADVVRRERAAALIYDDDLRELAAQAGRRRRRFVAWSPPGAAGGDEGLENMIAGGDPTEPLPPDRRGRVVILTSGTTGAPKGAGRAVPDRLDPIAGLLAAIPLRARETTMIAAPLFHAWGFLHWMLALGLGSTVVLRRRFDPEATLAATAGHAASALAVVPVMLERMLELPPAAIRRHDLSALRVIAVSGSALPGELATRAMDAFGERLYNLYGSTEVAWATVATPADLRAAPGTAGRPPRGTVVRVLDDDGRELPAGRTGRIFVGSPLVFEGYTGGGGKEVVGGLTATGDVGHFDAAGRLFVDGRADDMIVSGGENVFPGEVEDCIAAHPGVREVAVVGVPDARFGQRLKAYVVARDARRPSADEIRELVRSNLARYKVPRDVEFLAALPRNATGKVLRRELAARQVAGQPNLFPHTDYET